MSEGKSEGERKETRAPQIKHFTVESLQEDYRYHHFKSKGTQLINTFLETKIEWQELMQHHLIRTRLIDWSESAVSFLMFALEAFIVPKMDRELVHRRATMTPAIWVLNPRSLNYMLYN